MPIWCQADAKCIPIRCRSSADTSRSDVNPMPIQRQSCAHQASTCLNLMSIRCRSSANLMPIQCKSDVDQTPIHPNPIPILYQSDANPTPILPFQCRSWTDPPIHHQSNNPSPNCQSITNPPTQCKFITDPPTQCQSSPNPSQSNVNPGPIHRSIAFTN